MPSGTKELLYTFLNIPQFESLLVYKIGELELFYADEISHYLRLKNRFRKEAYGALELYDEYKSKNSQTYAFSLNYSDDNVWQVVELHPDVPACDYSENLIPEEVIEHIASFPVFSTKVVEKKNFCPPRMVNRKFNLQFVKYSDVHAFGSITEVFETEKSVNPSENDKNGNHVDASYNHMLFSNEEKLLELNQYMAKNQSFCNFVYSELFFKWKPFIDNNMV